MSRYTFTVRELCETYGLEQIKNWFSDYELGDVLDEVEIKTIKDKGLWSKEKLADILIDYYYMREIGFDSPGLFKLKLKNRLRVLSSEFLPLIYSMSIKYDPLVNVDYKEIFSRNYNDNGEVNSNIKNNSSGLTINSDTPQGEISKAKILNGDYASSTQAGENEDNQDSTSNTQNQGEEAYEKHFIGNSGVSATAQKMIEQYRDNIINVNRDIIVNIADLFISIF